jgi:hypothetical protein
MWFSGRNHACTTSDTRMIWADNGVREAALTNRCATDLTMLGSANRQVSLDVRQYRIYLPNNIERYKMKEFYDNLILQLDLLIGFLDVASGDVFELIKNHKAFNNESRAPRGLTVSGYIFLPVR